MEPNKVVWKRSTHSNIHIHLNAILCPFVPLHLVSFACFFSFFAFLPLLLSAANVGVWLISSGDPHFVNKHPWRHHENPSIVTSLITRDGAQSGRLQTQNRFWVLIYSTHTQFRLWACGLRRIRISPSPNPSVGRQHEGRWGWVWSQTQPTPPLLGLHHLHMFEASQSTQKGWWPREWVKGNVGLRIRTEAKYILSRGLSSLP